MLIVERVSERRGHSATPLVTIEQKDIGFSLPESPPNTAVPKADTALAGDRRNGIQFNEMHVAHQMPLRGGERIWISHAKVPHANA